jgi:tRNA (guanine37-N1)-methyltransferase
MVMMPEPMFAAVEAVQPARPLFLLSASGRRFDQTMARELAAGDGFSLICGRYEGVDQRVADHLCDGELSVGDFILSGGEAAALVVIEAVTRLLPGVMGNEASAVEESFSEGLLEYPQYTRPAELRGWTVPEVLRSGNHARIARWRQAQALRRTQERRPDLLVRELTAAEQALLDEFPDVPRPG